MFAQFARWFRPSAITHSAHRLYIALVEQARQPFFYAVLGVPDTVDGRFDQILLHCFLITHRLRAETERTDAQQLAIAITDAFFEDMDRSLREMGVGDVSVGKKIKKMAHALNGRFVAYEAALNDKEALAAALARNIYGATPPAPSQLSQLTDYVAAAHAALTKQPIDRLCHEPLPWPVSDTIAV